MYNWAYYKMVRHDNSVMPEDKNKQVQFDSLKKSVSKYKYAIMDEDNEMVDWFETYDEAESQLNQVMKGCDNKWKWYIKEVTDEMREKVINS